MKNKLKNSKSAGKRFKISSTGKLQHRRSGTDHFNAREGGDAGRHKKMQKILTNQNKKDIKNLMPYLSEVKPN
jgi:ribosomal protein L35